ncbi:MAG: cytochrome c [Chloroflexi bacterium]|nr:cytochrome c [Chloroflexota bacterium]
MSNGTTPMKGSLAGRLHMRILVVLLAAGTACQATSAAAPLATSAATRPAASPTASQEELVARGEVIFQKTAGGIGCQYCHGTDGKGKIGPSIRGKQAGDIRLVLQSVEAMSIVKLEEDEITAVAAYLQVLKTQP